MPYRRRRRTFRRRPFRRGTRRIRRKSFRTTGKNRFISKYGRLQAIQLYQITCSARQVVTQGNQILVAPNVWTFTNATNPVCGIMECQAFEKILGQMSVEIVAALAPNALPVAGNYEKPDRFVIRGCSASTTLVNQTQAGAWVEAFYCVARRDIPNVNASPYSAPSALLTQSFSDQGSTLSGTSLGTTPFQSKKWCQLFKIYKTKKLFMPSGANAQFTISRKKPYLVDFEKYGTKSGITGAITYSIFLGALKNVTKFIVFRFWGNPTNDVTTKTTVTTSALAIDSVTTYNYSYCRLGSEGITTAASDTATLNTGQTENILDEVSGSTVPSAPA